MSNKMPDVFDEIIDRLPPSILKMILDMTPDCLQSTANTNNLLNRTKQVRIGKITRELERKISDIKSKTSKNKIYLMKLKNELEMLKSLKEPDGNQKRLEPYRKQIKHLEMRLKNLFKDSGEIDLAELFNDIDSLYKQIQEHQKKIADVKIKYQCYKSLPPNINEAREKLKQMKNQIREKQSSIQMFS